MTVLLVIAGLLTVAVGGFIWLTERRFKNDFEQGGQS